MKTIALIGVLVLLAGCCTGCQPVGASNEIYLGGGHYSAGSVKMIILEDGTKCAVLYGYSKGALDCDWARASEAR